jgi:hypothetical protein
VQPATTEPVTLGDELEAWLKDDGVKTLGSLVQAFGDKSFAILFVFLLGVPALPVPTGGATHVLILIAILIALELIAGRHEVWLPDRWKRLSLAGDKWQRFLTSLTKFVRRLERFSRPRLPFLFRHRLADIVFGFLVIGGSIAAFVAPPFTGLDTLPALGVVLLALAMLFEDALVALAGLVVLVVGIVLEVVLGAAAVHGVSSLL